MKRITTRYFGVLLLLLAILVRFAFTLFPAAFRSVYFSELFPAIRSFQYSVSSMHPVAGFYILLIILIAWIVWNIPGIRKAKNGNFRAWPSWFTFGRRFVNFQSVCIGLFLLLWGYNYLEPGLSKRLNLEPSPYRNMLADAYLGTMERALIERSQIEGIERFESIEDITQYPNELQIEKWVREVLAPLGYPCEKGVTTRYVKPDGLLRALSISGIYNPFFGDAHVDNALGPLKKTFTIAHEMAHAYGVTSEADANFTAWLACMQSDNAFARYAAEYVLWRHLASEVNKVYPVDIVEGLVSAIPEPLQKDREAIWKNYYTYPGYFPDLAYSLNDTYLKLQGVEAGADDYDGFVNLWLDYSWSKLNK